MTRFGLLLTILAAGVVIVCGIAILPKPPSGFYSPQGYIDGADELIRTNKLRLFPAGSLAPGGRVVQQDFIQVEINPDSPQARFYVGSMLREDVRRFNADPSAPITPFDIRNTQIVGLNPYFHRVPLPFQRIPFWEGKIRVRPGASMATLRGSDGRMVSVVEAWTPQDRSHSRGLELFGMPDTVETVVAYLRSAAGDVAEFSFRGVSPVLIDRRHPAAMARDSLFVAGALSERSNAWVLRHNDWVRVRTDAGDHVFLLELGDERSIASFVRRRQGRHTARERLYPIDELRSISEPLARSMSGALSILSDSLGRYDAGLDTLGVVLGIDRQLAADLSRSFGARCRAMQLPDRPRSIGITVMDAFTGEVRAMASCPDEAMLARYEPLPVRDRTRFARNQNLHRHPVGSATKPFWAAAITTTYPALLDLQVRSNGDTNEQGVFDCAAGYENNSAAGWISFENFLERSSNKYMVDLATTALLLGERTRSPACSAGTAGSLAACFQPAPDPECRICGQMFAPRLQGVVTVGSQSCALRNVGDFFRPQVPLRATFGVETRGFTPVPARMPGEAIQAWSGGRFMIEENWRPLLEVLGARVSPNESSKDDSILVALAFRGISAERTVLELPAVSDLRRHWVAMLLGGDNGLWSNLALASSTATLLTGRRVEPRLASWIEYSGAGAAPPEPSPLLSLANLHPGARRRILHGLELTITGANGTAKPLQERVEELRRQVGQEFGNSAFEIYAFAKTGTADVDKYVAPTMTLVLRRAVNAGMYWDGARVVVSDSARRILRRSLSAADFNQIIVLTSQISAVPADHIVGPEEAPRNPLFLRGGRLQVADRELRLERKGAMLIFGLLAVPAGRGRLASAGRPDAVSICPAVSATHPANQIPPADWLDPNRSVSVSLALYIDDLPANSTSEVAVNFLADSAIWNDLQRYFLRELATRGDFAGNQRHLLFGRG